MNAPKNYGSMIQTGPTMRPRRIFIMGVEGVGKTTALTQCPNPILMCAEDGVTEANFAGVKSFAPADWQDALGFIDYLTTGTHDFKSYCLDTLDWMEPLAIRGICNRDGKKDIEDYGGFGKGQIVLANEIRNFLCKIEQLQKTKGMLIVITAHCTVKPFNNPIGDNYDRYEPQCEKKVAALVKQWADVCLFAKFDVATFKDSRKARAKGIGGQKRIVHTTHSAAWDAKNRCGLPDEMDFSMPSILEAIQKGTPDSAENLFADAVDLAGKYLTDESKKKATLEYLEKNKTNIQNLTIALNKLRTIASATDEETTETRAA
jgi:hypothetical protein